MTSALDCRRAVGGVDWRHKSEMHSRAKFMPFRYGRRRLPRRPCEPVHETASSGIGVAPSDTPRKRHGFAFPAVFRPLKPVAEAVPVNNGRRDARDLAPGEITQQLQEDRRTLGWVLQIASHTLNRDLFGIPLRSSPAPIYAASLAGPKRAASQPSMTRLRLAPHS